ncbi:hypothetical protein RJ640_016792 [Escallonia rubra]|uniref:ER membrane protein complex subunit 10 n=1 Tax=Escallonia rubra TaxID=112253 RepID=A0AA88QYA2_9ASTE|nr:hypothetical protein RJ640_016792 [Escallonia rubra]
MTVRSFFWPRLLLCFSLLVTSSFAFQSDELLLEDEEFGLEGGPRSSDLDLTVTPRSPPSQPAPSTTRRRSADPDSDSKVQFSLEHAFGDSDFSAAGAFSARLKTWSDFTGADKENFKKLLEGDEFYRIRVPSNVLSPPGRDYITSSVKAEGVNIVAVNYGSPGACQYPRQLKIPAKWSFKSHTVLKNSEQAPRTPAFSEDNGAGEIGEDEGVKPLERSFWAKYWMYLIPLGLIVMNAITQAMNMPEEQASGQPGSQAQQPIGANTRGPNTAVRRR